MRPTITLSLCLLTFLSTSSHAGVEVAPPLQVEVLVAGGPIQSVGDLLADGGMLYASDPMGHGIVAIEPKSRATTVLASGLPLSSVGQMIAGDGGWLGDDLIVADWNSEETSPCCDGRVFRVDRVTGAVSVLSTGHHPGSITGDPIGVAYSPSSAFGDRLLVMDFQGASPDAPFLFAVEPSGSTSVVASDPVQWSPDQAPKKIAFGGDAFGGDLFVADTRPGAARLWRVTGNGDVIPFPTSTPLTSPGAIAFGKGGDFGDAMYVVDGRMDGSAVLAIDPTGQVTPILSGLASAAPGEVTGLAFADDGASMFVGVGDVVYHASSAVPWTILGGASAGTSGEPCLLGSGTLIPGEPTALYLFDAPPSVAGLLVLGFHELNLSLFGGTLIPQPDVLVSLPIDADGRVKVGGPWPGGVPVGTKVYFQYWLPDAGGVGGYASSNGLRLLVP